MVDDATPSIVINYKSRKEAELAMSKGRNFQDRVLSITWVASPYLHRPTPNNSGTTGTNLQTSTPSQRSTEQLQSMTDEEIDLEVISYFFKLQSQNLFYMIHFRACDNLSTFAFSECRCGGVTFG